MPIITMKEALTKARKEKYAIGAFNISSMTFLQAILKAAEINNSPVIIQIAEGHITDNAFRIEDIAITAVTMAQHSPVPIVFHLDHGLTLPTIMKCIKNGFSSIMIDASSLPYEENITTTQEIVKICHAIGISVEGELGTLGGSEASHSGSECFTKPEEAADYVQRTGIDCFAVSIGNVHGNYKGEPNLDFHRLEQIAKSVSVPLVLHGGSGISDQDFQKAIRLGINKINFYTGNCKSAFQAVESIMAENPTEKGTDILSLFKKIEDAVIATVSHNMKVFGSINKG
ncbi:MAG: class II fructose-bisphosphate aldolase [Brevinema sp.]